MTAPPPLLLERLWTEPMGWAEPKAERAGPKGWAEPMGLVEPTKLAEPMGWAELKRGVSRDGPALPPFRAAVDGAYGVGGAYEVGVAKGVGGA